MLFHELRMGLTQACAPEFQRILKKKIRDRKIDR